jgi:hypothetical protein
VTIPLIVWDYAVRTAPDLPTLRRELSSYERLCAAPSPSDRRIFTDLHDRLEAAIADLESQIEATNVHA